MTPICAICSAPVLIVSARDVAAGGRRPWFCSTECFVEARSAEQRHRSEAAASRRKRGFQRDIRAQAAV